MAITKTKTLDLINISVSGTKIIRSTYGTVYTDDSTSPDTIAVTHRETTYGAADTIPSGEDQLVKDLAAILFA